MSNPDFVYTTYIKSTPEKVWGAIITPEFARQYWGQELHSDWKKGSRWSMTKGGCGGDAHMTGEILESTPPARLVMTWASSDNQGDASKVTFDIEKKADMVRLTVTHSQLSAEMGGRISQGWPRVLSGLKSFLETGTALDIAATA